MPNLIRTGIIPFKDMKHILKEVKQIKHLTYKAEVGRGDITVYDPTIRMCKIYYPTPDEFKFTFNYIISLIIENYTDIKLDYTKEVSIQYTRYDPGDHFAVHSDIIFKDGAYNNNGMYYRPEQIRGMTISINISDSDSYCGGDLTLPYDSIKLSRDIGSFIAFPAYKQHSVDTITSGIRESLVAWVYMTSDEIVKLRELEYA